MDQTVEFLHRSAIMVLFIIALGYGIILVKAETTLHMQLQENIKEDTTYIETMGLTDDILYSGSQVILQIYNMEDLQTEIVVDGNSYLPDLEKNHVNVGIIEPTATYKQSYERDEQGHLTKIIYINTLNN